MKKINNTYKTIDLFAGIGGIRIGFESTGYFETVFANDFDKPCKVTYDHFFETVKLDNRSILDVPTKELPPFDFLLGGFPCQAFSIAGYRKGFDDDKGRGNLFFAIERILRETEDFRGKKPLGFLLENVKNLKTHDHKRTYETIYGYLHEKLGYYVKTDVLNSMKYGNVPQNRERIYIVGFRDKEAYDAFEFPKETELTKNVQDILDKDVPEKYYYDNKPLYPRIKDHIEEGNVYQWRRKYVRKNQKGVCPTLTANMGMGGHNVPIIKDSKGIRKLTPQECLRIQGFPKKYKFPDTLADSALYKQAGNSVTVPVIRRIAEKMYKAVSCNTSKEDEKYYAQANV